MNEIGNKAAVPRHYLANKAQKKSTTTCCIQKLKGILKKEQNLFLKLDVIFHCSMS